MTSFQLDAIYSMIAFIALILIGISVFNFATRKRLITPIILFIIGYTAKPFIRSFDVVPFILLALIVVIFDAGSSFVPRGFDNLSSRVVKMIISSLSINCILCMLLLHVSVFQSITLISVMLSLLTGVLITASTQHDLLGLSRRNHKETIILELEDNLSNPIVILIGVILLEFIISLAISVDSSVGNVIYLVFQQILLEIGIGLIFGMILLTIVVRFFNRDWILLPAMVLAVFAFILSVYLDATGLIAVLVMSLFFHNIISRRNAIEPYSSKISHMAYIVIFLLMGFAAKLSIRLIIISLSIFMLYMLMRHFLSLRLFPYHSWSFSLDCQKGLAIGAFAAYSLLIIDPALDSLIPALGQIMQILIWISIFSITVSYSTKLHDHRIGTKHKAVSPDKA